MDDPQFVLMYRQPGEEDHEKLTDVMDSVILQLRSLQNEVESLKDQLNSFQNN